MAYAARIMSAGSNLDPDRWRALSRPPTDFRVHPKSYIDKVAEYRSGKDKLFGFFVGQTMKESGGKANPAMVNQLLKAKLAG